MTRPEPFAVDCPPCGWGSGAAGLAEAEQLAGTHDDQEHRGVPTAWVAEVNGQSSTDQERRAE